MPTAEEVQAELAKVQSIDNFFGKDGVFARLLATTPQQILVDEHNRYVRDLPWPIVGGMTLQDTPPAIPEPSPN
jgi:hypothetical protein